MEPTTHPLALRPKQAARLLSISQRTLWAWTKAGLLPHVRIGGAVLYPVAELEAWLRQQAARQQAEAAAGVVEGQGNGDAR
jgi:excisionase family DNA binding protein